MHRVKTYLNEWAGLFALVGLILGGFWYQGNRFDTKIDNLTVLVLQEMKDFHGRLERQDAEFKAHMTYYHQ